TGAACASASIGGAPAAPQVSGTQITFTAVASGCSHASPLYQFVLRPASKSTWHTRQAYSTHGTYIWNSTEAVAVTEYSGVWAKDASSGAAYDANASTPTTVT